MKIAVILKKDVDNFMTALLVKELKKQQYFVDAYAIYQEKNHLYMFENIDISIQNAKILTTELIEQYDILLTYPKIFLDISWLLEAKTYIISFDSAYYDEPLSGTDLLIERGINWRPPLPCGHRAETAYLIAGDPKHDTWNLKDITEDPKQLLFIDSGHYPFGENGKRETARFILNVCNRFPDYHLIVKPRFLKSDKSVTHENTLFLYDFIEQEADGTLPDNLTLLEKHLTLEELIAASHTVITLYTTAYIDAAVQGKNLLILDNIPNEEHPELRIKTHWMPAREIMKGSGCLVDYREAINYLPHGMKCQEEHLQKHIYSRGAINSKIVKSIEWLWEHYISHGHYPAPNNYFYDKLEESIQQIIPIEKLLTLRKKNYLYCLERFFYKDTAYYPKYNQVSDYIEALESRGTLQNAPIEELISEINEKLLEYAPDIPKDSISQDYLLTLIFRSNRPERIFTLNRENILNKVFYDYISGKVHFSKQQYQEASLCLHRYLDGCEEHVSAEGLQDMPAYHLSGLYYCGLADMNLQHYAEAKECFLLCEKETNGNHQKAKEQLEIIQQMEERKPTSIRLLVMDVDGTLTDGKIYQSAEGETIKAFDVKDGYGIHVLLPKHQIKSAIITGRCSPITEYRAKELNMDAVMQDISDKPAALHALSDKLQIPLSETAYIGDDLNDLDCIRLCGLSACPADAVAAIKTEVDYICNTKGGQGAVREWIDWILSHKHPKDKEETDNESGCIGTNQAE